MAQKFAEHFTKQLRALGYTHCFLVPGGAIMHLVEAARNQMTCVPFVHEVSAVIAAEYFNEVAGPIGAGRAYALVTAGPGVTNAVTGLAGAFLESREVLVVGGQVKSADLGRGNLRQRGIQEVDGVAIAAPVSKAAVRWESPVADHVIASVVASGHTGRPGPVFIEICLDAQGADVDTQGEAGEISPGDRSSVHDESAKQAAAHIVERLRSAKRPVLLLGGGIQFSVAENLREQLESCGVPLMTTWNGFDRVADDQAVFAGRPNTWGQRSANILLAQADLIIALGTRLGLQQTGFNWEEWGASADHVIHVDLDAQELEKGHPRTDERFQTDANRVLEIITQEHFEVSAEWLEFCHLVRQMVPLVDPANTAGLEYISPYKLVDELADFLGSSDILIPASSGSGQFVPMEVFRLTQGQRVITNKGLAAMGYGLAGAIGAALAAESARVVLVEGDGSFSQNIQELGTVAIRNLNVKMIVLDNDGYASIRTTQRTYFNGNYIGCDAASGLGFPDWKRLADAFGIASLEVDGGEFLTPEVKALMDMKGPALIIAKVDPEQTYYPKVTSRVSEGGVMESNPIHSMSPALPDDIARQVFRYLKVPG